MLNSQPNSDQFPNCNVRSITVNKSLSGSSRAISNSWKNGASELGIVCMIVGGPHLKYDLTDTFQTSLRQGCGHIHAIFGRGPFIVCFVEGAACRGFETFCFGPIHGEHGTLAIAAQRRDACDRSSTVPVPRRQWAYPRACGRHIRRQVLHLVGMAICVISLPCTCSRKGSRSPILIVSSALD